jgi:hypothetical protein
LEDDEGFTERRAVPSSGGEGFDYPFVDYPAINDDLSILFAF